MNGRSGIIHLGEIKWFGGYNSKRDRYNNCGVLVGEIFFFGSVFDSPNKEKYIRSQLQNQPAFFSFVQEGNANAGVSWVKPVREMTEEELLQLYRENESVKQELNISTNYLRLFETPTFETLFDAIMKEQSVHDILEDIGKNKNIPAHKLSYIMQRIPWDKLSEKDAIGAFLSLPAGLSEKTNILKTTFPAWIDDNRVLEELKVGYFPECISNGIEANDIQSISRLFHNVSNQNVKRQIASYLPIELFLEDLELCRMLSDDRITELFSDKFDAEKLAIVLSIIEPAVYPNSAVALGKKMLENNLPLGSWKLLNITEKVWLVLMLSLHLPDANSWKKSFGEIYLYEHNTIQPKNSCVLAVIDFLTIALVNDDKKQATFIKAHTELEEAIIHDFETSGGPSNELMQLICRCKTDSSSVCAARYWKNNNTIWCNMERRTCSGFRNLEDEIDYKITSFEYSKKYSGKSDLSQLSMADLLNRLDFIPNLDDIYNPMFGYRWNFEEYPYRIGGRIQQLINLFSHMHCRCGKLMKSRYSFSIKINSRMAITHAYCPDASDGNDEHDPDVYLNECWNCDEVIDSRDSRFIQDNMGNYYPATRNDIKGYYVCMKCGAGTKDMVPSVCPSCGCGDQKMLEYTTISEQPLKRKFKKCKNIDCGFSSKNWVSPFGKFIRKNESERFSMDSFNMGSTFYLFEDDEIEE